MKIDRIEVHGYELSYRYGNYIMSGNQVITSIPSKVVRIITNSGIKGWGKVCPARAALSCLLWGRRTGRSATDATGTKGFRPD
jgi:hypothetical protein